MEDDKVIVTPAVTPNPDAVKAELIKLERFDDYGQIIRLSEAMFRSGMIPASIPTPQALAVVMLYGQELGCKPFTSIQQIHLIQGKPAPSVHLVAAQLQRRGIEWKLVADMEPIYNDKGAVVDLVTKIEFYKWNEKFGIITNTIPFYWVADGLPIATVPKTGELKDNWKNYQRVMMRNRCLVIGARFVDPSALMGYEVAEIADFAGGEVFYDNEGNPTKINGNDIQSFE